MKFRGVSVQTHAIWDLNQVAAQEIDNYNIHKKNVFENFLKYFYFYFKSAPLRPLFLKITFQKYDTLINFVAEYQSLNRFKTFKQFQVCSLWTRGVERSCIKI